MGGCWPGHRMSDRELVYRHPAVRWVWRTGGQLGAIFCVPALLRNDVSDLKTGDGCVILAETGPGDIAWSPWGVSTAIGLESGSPVFGWPLDKHEWTYISSSERSEADRRLVVPLTPQLENVWDDCSQNELYVRWTGSSGKGIKLLALREFELMGWVDHVVKFPGNVIVVGTTGYVLCIELDELRTRPSGTGSSLQP